MNMDKFHYDNLKRGYEQLQAEKHKLEEEVAEYEAANHELHAELAKAKPILDAAMNYAQAEGWLDKSKNIEHCGTEGCFHCELGLAVREYKAE